MRGGGATEVLGIFTEQRLWTGPGGLAYGRQPLGALHPVAAHLPCRVIGRESSRESSGTPVLPDQHSHRLVAWTSSNGATVMRLLRALHQVVSEVRRSRAIAVYCPGLIGSLAGIVALTLRKPILAIVVGDPQESLSPDVVGGVHGRLARFTIARVMRLICRRARITQYVTQAHLQQAYPPGKRTRAHAFSDVGKLTFGHSRPFPRERPVNVLSVGTLDQPYKGIQDLIQAISLCRSQGIDVRLTVVGEGRLRRKLSDEARDLLQDHAEFVGAAYGYELENRFEAADCFALASWTEGMPRVLLEAMAQGLPCVATSVGGIPEILSEEQLVVAREPTSMAGALSRLVTDEDLWKRAAEAGWEQARRIRDDAMAAQAELVWDVAMMLRERPC